MCRTVTRRAGPRACYRLHSAGTLANMDLEAVAAALAPRVLAYAWARTGSRSLAEDVAQDALTALVQCWRRRGPPESPAAFVFAIVKRRAGRRSAETSSYSARLRASTRWWIAKLETTTSKAKPGSGTSEPRRAFDTG